MTQKILSEKIINANLPHPKYVSSSTCNRLSFLGDPQLYVKGVGVMIDMCDMSNIIKMNLKKVYHLIQPK